MKLTEIFKPHMQKQDTNRRKALLGELRIAYAIHYLTQGGSFRSTANFFRAPYSSVRASYNEMLELLCGLFRSKYVVWPQGEYALQNIAHFQSIANIPQIVACMDGSHFRI